MLALSVMARDYSYADIEPMSEPEPEELEELEGCVDCGSEDVFASCPVRRETLCKRCWSEEIQALPVLTSTSTHWKYLASGRVLAWFCCGPSLLSEAEADTIEQAMDSAQVRAWRPLALICGAEIKAYRDSLKPTHAGPGPVKAFPINERESNEAANS